MKGVLKALLALVIIAGGAGIGYLLANNTDLGKASTATPTTAAVAAGPAAAATPIPTFTPLPASSPLAVPGAAGGTGRNGGTAGANGTATGGGRNGNNGTPGAGAAATTPGANVTPGAGAATTPGAGGAAQGQRGNNVAGTIASYDAGAKMLVITAQNGNKRNISIANATLNKADKISLDDISKTNGAILLVQGQQESDGAFSARSITLVDPAATAGAGGRGFPGGGGFGGGAAGGQGGFVVLNGATVNGTTISGKSFQGEDVKVNVSDTTTMTKQVAAAPEDLTEGKRVTVTGQAKDNGDIEATLVNIAA